MLFSVRRHTLSGAISEDDKDLHQSQAVVVIRPNKSLSVTGSSYFFGCKNQPLAQLTIFGHFSSGKGNKLMEVRVVYICTILSFRLYYHFLIKLASFFSLCFWQIFCTIRSMSGGKCRAWPCTLVSMWLKFCPNSYLRDNGCFKLGRLYACIYLLHILHPCVFISGI